ncbi:MAG TPA: LptF/LptG family permease [Anaeromyxobacter sp.]|nr:LptF/LptG family permease [Anaeromyxobacter sp.]
MPLLDRYLAREILPPMAAGLLFLTQLLLATQVLTQASVLFGAGVSLADLGLVIFFLLPYFVGFVLPVAFLLGVVLGVGRLSGDREVVALGAAGLSPLRLVRVPLLLSLGAAGLGLWLALFLEPAGMRSVRTLMNEIVKRNVSSEVRAGTFYEQIPGYTLYAERAAGGSWENVLIQDRTNPDVAVLSLSRRGRLEPVGEGQEMRLGLEDGELHREEVRSDGYVLAVFDRAELVLGLGGGFAARAEGLGRNARGISLAETRAQIADAYARGRPDEAWYIEGHLHRKVAAALVVFSFALLGVPLGASGRAGRAFGAGATLLVMVAHYILLRAGQILVQRGTVPAWLGLELGNAVVALVGLLLLLRMALRGTGAVR